MRRGGDVFSEIMWDRGDNHNALQYSTESHPFAKNVHLLHYTDSRVCPSDFPIAVL